MTPATAGRWLAQNGDPYVASIVDRDGRVGIDYGVYGVPETFLIDKAGVVRYKQIGPITPEALQQKILPLVRELQTMKRKHRGARADAACIAGLGHEDGAAGDRRIRSRRGSKKLETELRCLVCQNQTLADSNADLRRRSAGAR